MDYKIYTLAEDIKIEKTSSLIATVGDIRAAIEDLSKYTEEQLFEELEKRGLCKTRILEDKEANDYLVLEEIKELFDANSKAKIKSIKNREKENEVVLEKIKKLISFFYKNQSEIIN